jgi:drug/metabolite transporter (DMT)-like permease
MADRKNFPGPEDHHRMMALLAAVLLREAMYALRIAGGIMMLIGIGIAHQGRRSL